MNIISTEHELIGRWMARNDGGFWRPGAKCLGLIRDGALVAGVMFDWYNGTSIYVSIVVRGLVTREFLWAICDYPFRQLGCKVVIATVAEGNRASRQFVEHFGFEYAGAIPDGDPSGDLLIYTIRPNQCKWLKTRSRHGETLTTSRS